MEKLKNLIRALDKSKLDSLFVKSEANITFLTGFSGDSSRLLVSPGGTFLFTDGRYIEQAEKECPKEVTIVNWIDDVRYSSKTYSVFAEKAGVRAMGFESNLISHGEFLEISKIKNIDLKAVDGIVEKFRQIKSEKEINTLRHASEISDKALESTIQHIKPGITELDLVAELEYNMRKNGAENISFETIVLFGEKSSLLHGKPGLNKLKQGDIILFDFGALFAGYHADISRVMVCGKANNRQKEIFDIVNRAGLKAIEMLRSGVTIEEVDNTVRSVIPEDHSHYFYPGIGHGVGLEIHENPFVRQNTEGTIEQGMVLTIEPGLYIPDWGGMRVEDTILIQENDCEPLNKLSRNLIEI